MLDTCLLYTSGGSADGHRAGAAQPGGGRGTRHLHRHAAQLDVYKRQVDDRVVNDKACLLDVSATKRYSLSSVSYTHLFQPEYIETLSSEQTDLLRCFLQRPFPVANYLPLNEQEATEIEFYICLLYTSRCV